MYGSERAYYGTTCMAVSDMDTDYSIYSFSCCCHIFFSCCLQTFFEKYNRKKVKVKACLVSKVEEKYKEVKTNIGKAGLQSPQSGFRYGKEGTAYRLYFKTDKKYIQLDVTKEIYDRLEEGSVGELE